MLKPDMRIPNFQTFLKNSQNKERMLAKIEEVIIEERRNLKGRVIFFARGSNCLKIEEEGVTNVTALKNRVCSSVR